MNMNTKKILKKLGRLTALHEMAVFGSYSVLKKLAKNPNTPPEILSKLYKKQNLYIQEIVARNPNTPVNILKNARDADVVCNPKAPADILDKIVRKNSINLDCYGKIAKHPNAHTGIMQYMYNRFKYTDYYTLLGKIAKNRESDPITLAALAHHKRAFVRASVASNPIASKEILEKLSQDSSSLVKMAILKNKNTSLSVIKFLSKDNCQKISEFAKTLLNSDFDSTFGNVLRLAIKGHEPIKMVDKLLKT